MIDSGSDVPPHRIVAFAVATFLVLIVLYFPWNPEVIRPGLDPSFRYGLNELHARSAQFGSQIIHQYGPYGFLRNSLYHPETFRALLVWRVLFLAVFAAMAARVATRFSSSSLGCAIWLTVLMIFARFGDPFFHTLPLLALIVFWSSTDVRNRVLWSPVVVLLAVTSLMKFTYALLSFSVIVLVLIAAIIEQLNGPSSDCGPRERLKVVSVAAWPVLFVVALVLSWLAAGQTLAELPSFFVSRLRLAGTYAESHAKWGPPFQVLSFGVAAASFWLIFTGRELVRLGLRSIAPSLALALALFLAFKHAFVRHDPAHAVLGAFNLLCIAAVFGLLTLRRDPEHESLRWPAVMATVVMVVAGVSLLAPSPANGYGSLRFRHADIPKRVVNAGRLLSQPSRSAERHEKATARIRRRFSLPRLRGMVDVYPRNLSVVFAHGLDYAPRPTLQSYQAVDPCLAEANAGHLARPDGPDHLLFDIRPVDRRYPSLEDGPSWPTLLAAFRPRLEKGGFLILDRNPRPRRISWSDVGTLEISARETVEIEASDSELLWATIEMDRTVRGRLWGTIFKGPAVYLHVVLGTGRQGGYRIVPGMAEAGFLLSPLVATRGRFAALYSDDWPEDLAGLRVREMRIEVQFGESWYYEPEIQVRLHRLQID